MFFKSIPVEMPASQTDASEVRNSTLTTFLCVPRTEPSLKDAIEHALAPLLGLPLLNAGRAGAMLWLQLGEQRTIDDDRLGPRDVGDFALHVSCPWRILGPEGIHAASGDLFTPADPDADPTTFEWDQPGANWCDIRLRAFIDATADAPRAVSGVSADEIGSLRVFLGDDFVLDVFPDSSHADHIESEYWRLLQPGTAAAHVVVGSEGIEHVPGA